MRWPSWRRAERAPAPMPIVVGVGRSGTTLLRLMLDAHPQLAMPAETGFLPAVQQRAASGTLDPAGLAQLLATFPTWDDFRLDPAVLRRRLEGLRPFDAADGVRAFYRLYAAGQGKSRWGDKTPSYAQQMPAVASLLPEARFVHIVRDGRDVALSMRPLWWAPSTDLGALAAHWKAIVLGARRDAAGVPHYLEVRYEELVRDPGAVLRRVCEFVELPFSPAMLDYPRRAPQRLAELADHQAPHGVVTREQRWSAHRLLREPPQAERIGHWRRAMSREEVAAFEAEAGDLLTALGYPLADGVTAPPAS